MSWYKSERKKRKKTSKDNNSVRLRGPSCITIYTVYEYYMKRIRGIRGRVQQGVLEIRRWINRAVIAKVKRSARFVARKVGPRASLLDQGRDYGRFPIDGPWKMVTFPRNVFPSFDSNRNELFSIVLPRVRLVVNHHYSRPTDICSKNTFLQRFVSKNVL